MRLGRRADLFHAHRLSVTAIPALLVAARLGRPVMFKCTASGEFGNLAQLARRAPRTAEAAVRPHWGPLEPLIAGAGRLEGRLALRLMRRSGARVVALSTRMVAELLAAGFGADQVELIPNGVDLTHFVPARDASAEWVGPRTVLCLASLRAVKGIDVL